MSAIWARKYIYFIYLFKKQTVRARLVHLKSKQSKQIKFVIIGVIQIMLKRENQPVEEPECETKKKTPLSENFHFQTCE